MNISLKHFVIYQINLNYEINKTHSNSTSWLLVLYKLTWLRTKWSTIKYNTSNRILNNYVLCRCFIAVNDMVMFQMIYKSGNSRSYITCLQMVLPFPPIFETLIIICNIYEINHNLNIFIHYIFPRVGMTWVCVYICVCRRGCVYLFMQERWYTG